ncbi:hypothetical protein EMIT0P2_10260 [Pseudomonas sp. IT-P2]
MPSPSPPALFHIFFTKRFVAVKNPDTIIGNDSQLLFVCYLKSGSLNVAPSLAASFQPVTQPPVHGHLHGRHGPGAGR